MRDAHAHQHVAHTALNKELGPLFTLYHATRQPMRPTAPKKRLEKLQRPASPLVLSSGATPSRMALSASASVRSSEMTIAAPEDQARALPARDDAGCTLQAAAACNDCFQRPLAFKFLAFFTRF